MKLSKSVWTMVWALGLSAACVPPAADEGDDEAETSGEDSASEDSSSEDSSSEDSSSEDSSGEDSSSEDSSSEDSSGEESETQGDGFALVDAEFEDPSTIVLTFSEPLGSLEGLDPAAFRISYAESTLSVEEGTEYPFTFYVDPNIFMVDPDCEDIYGQVCPEFVAFEIESLEAGAIPEQLRLHTSAPLDEAVCEKIAYTDEHFEPEPPNQFEYGIFPHYAPGETPLRSAEGDELAPIGPDWVLFEGDPIILGGGALKLEEFGFENLAPKLPIPCPEF